MKVITRVSCNVKISSRIHTRTPLFARYSGNLHNLFCGLKSGCTSVDHNLTVRKLEYIDCAQHDASKCLPCTAAGTGCCGSTTRNESDALLSRDCDGLPNPAQLNTVGYVAFVSVVVLLVAVVVAVVIGSVCAVLKRHRNKRKTSRYGYLESERLVNEDFSYRGAEGTVFAD